ncbi:MAG: hypothetical protein RBT64_04310 [Trichloromonas sp.]|nr:hypothetical protein [Trichloromonas sp.]
MEKIRERGACGYKKGLLFTLRLAHARITNDTLVSLFTPPPKDLSTGKKTRKNAFKKQ